MNCYNGALWLTLLSRQHNNGANVALHFILVVRQLEEQKEPVNVLHPCLWPCHGEADEADDSPWRPEVCFGLSSLTREEQEKNIAVSQSQPNTFKTHDPEIGFN